MQQGAPEWNLSFVNSSLASYLPYVLALDSCLFGSPWSIRMEVRSSWFQCVSAESVCAGGHVHQSLDSSATRKCDLFRNGLIWPLMASKIAQGFSGLFGTSPSKDVKHLAGLSGGHSDCSFHSILDRIGFKPSGKRATSAISARVAACVQPARRVAPMLIPEGLGPAAHLSVALAAQHPFLRTPALHPVAEEALESQPSALELIAKRNNVVEVLEALAELLLEECLKFSCSILLVEGDRKPIYLVFEISSVIDDRLRFADDMSI